MAKPESIRHDIGESFWSEIFRLHQSVTPLVARRVLCFGLYGLVLYFLNWHIKLALDLGPYEVAGAVLGFLLVFRTNAGYDRWYEGRKMWGQIVNQSRNLAITTLAHGPEHEGWRRDVIHWIASFGHVTRALLRNEPVPPEVRALLGEKAAQQIASSGHMPSYVALQIGELLREAVDRMGMDPFGFLEADRERAMLIDYEGSCERIRNTPVPPAYSINIRRLSFLYLAAVPFGLLQHLGSYDWLTGPLMLLIAYAILAMDQIGVELQRPFFKSSLNHLPLDELTAQIERNVVALLAADGPPLVTHSPE